jgi:hypothetical protein
MKDLPAKPPNPASATASAADWTIQRAFVGRAMANGA